jgi:hypothetical protein
VRRLLLALAVAVGVAACGGGAATTRSPAACVPAPAWLIAKINENMTTKGVTLKTAFVAPATDISGAAGSFNEPGATAWWVGGKLTGVDEPPAYWLVDSLDEDQLGEIEGANSVAKDHNNWGVLGPDAVVVARGSEGVSDCLTSNVTSEPSASAEPPTPKPLALKVTKITKSVAAGDAASVTIQTAKGAACSITVTYESGDSTANGLGNKRANSEGRVYWKWQVGPNTSPQTALLTVFCEAGDRSGVVQADIVVK